jgi:hypothetical protein
MGTCINDGNGIENVAIVLEQILDEDGALGDLALDANIDVIRRSQGNHVYGHGSIVKHINCNRVLRS